jgi:hypothetical protein
MFGNILNTKRQTEKQNFLSKIKKHTDVESNKSGYRKAGKKRNVPHRNGRCRGAPMDHGLATCADRSLSSFSVLHFLKATQIRIP